MKKLGIFAGVVSAMLGLAAEGHATNGVKSYSTVYYGGIYTGVGSGLFAFGQSPNWSDASPNAYGQKINLSTGALNTSFGTSGTANVGSTPSIAYASALASTGDLMVVGSSEAGIPAQGSQGSGKVTVLSSTGSVLAHNTISISGVTDLRFLSVAQGSGFTWYAAAGMATTASGTFGIVARFTATGALDTAFNSTGYVIHSAASESHSITVQPDGKIVAAGITGAVSGSINIWRLSSTGSTLDDVTLTPPSELLNVLYVSSIQPVAISGGLYEYVITGGGQIGGPSEAALVGKLGSNLAPDTSFHGDGYRTYTGLDANSVHFAGAVFDASGFLVLLGQESFGSVFCRSLHYDTGAQHAHGSISGVTTLNNARYSGSVSLALGKVWLTKPGAGSSIVSFNSNCTPNTSW